MEDSNDHHFATYDRDQDGSWKYHCAIRFAGAWWYPGLCGQSNLNSDYHVQRKGGGMGVWWYQFPSSDYMKRTEMMLRCQG